jgi:ribosomal protein S18 acetylase RimI-like enzyme
LVRACDWACDAAAIERIDTSFVSESAYSAYWRGQILELALRRLETRRRKQFPINPETEGWQQGYVAESEGAVRGFVAANFEGWNKRLCICHFYVDLPFRRRGAGRELMTAALEWGRRMGALTAWLETTHTNYPGVEAYRALGFEIAGFDTTLYLGTSNPCEFPVYLARRL